MNFQKFLLHHFGSLQGPPLERKSTREFVDIFKTTTWHLHSELKSEVSPANLAQRVHSLAFVRRGNGTKVEKGGGLSFCEYFLLELNQMLFQSSLSSFWLFGKTVPSVATC